MRSLKCGLVCVLWIALLGGWISPLSAQTSGINIGVKEGKSVEPEPDSITGIPYSKVLRDADPPYERLFSDIHVGSYEDVKVGSGGALFQTHLFNGPAFNIPLVSRGGKSQHAQVKIGLFYLDFRYFSASVLFSDNVNLTPTNTRSGVIGIMRLGMVGIMQISDNLRLSMAGTLVYLPFRSKIGIAGFGIDDAFANLLEGPLARAQLAYNMEIGKWDVQVYDDLGARHRRIGIGEDFSYFNGVAFDEEDRAGRYVYGDNTTLPPGSGLSRQENGNIDASLIEVYNTVGFSAGRVLPTVTRVEFGARHSDYWYQGDRGTTPTSKDEVYGLAQSERENMRFKPFVKYRADRFNFDNSWHHELVGGLSGPLTQNIGLLGEGGYHWSDDLPNDVTLWRAQITHTINPLTYHQFDYFRKVTEPVRDIQETYFYRIQRILGPYLTGEAYAAHSTFEPLSSADQFTVENRFGVRFTSPIGLRTFARAGFAYSQIEVGKPKKDDIEAWRARLELNYRGHRNTSWLITYQYYTASSSTQFSRNADENLVILTWVKNF